ncbi:MAG: TonB-dependent receptor [Parabacteroides sp.]|nr:TonB-dependent receptor [Parabacteroides sp.]
MATALLCLNIPLIAQNVTINLNNVSVKQAMDELKSITGYTFVYSSNDLDSKKKISVSANDEDIEAVIGQILNGQKVSYEIKDKTIIVKKITNTTKTQQSAPKKITGTVVDDAGIPVIGANVMVKGTTNGTITDLDGKFVLDVPEGSVLEISYIGYLTQTVKANGGNISVALKEDTQKLDEVVVVGYGTQTKSSLTSSIVEIKGDKLTNLPVSNISRAIDSYVPGITASATLSEKPGSSTELSIRGENSINNSAPLVLIDGIEGDMSTISPNDVDNISVLKDAASTSIYGARAAGGVILITTKKGGKNEKIRVNYSGAYSLREATRLPEKLSGWDYAQYRITAESAAGQVSEFDNQAVLDAIRDPNITEIPAPGRPLTHFIGTADVDHVKEMMGTANMHDHSLSITGGNNKISFLVSGNILKEDALFKYGDFGFIRYNMRSNIDFDLTDRISMGVRINFSNSNTDQPVRGWDTEIHQAYLSQPTMPIKWTTTGDWGGNNDGNSIQDLVEGGHHIIKTDRLDFSANLSVNILKGLKWNTIVGGSLNWNNATREEKSIYRYSVKPGVPVGKLFVPNNLIRENTKTLYRNIQTFFNYSLPSISNHNIGIMAGSSYEDQYSDFLYGNRQEFLSNDLMGSLDLGIGDQYSGGNITEWGIASVFARFNYNYNKKYFLEASFRSDASSRFVKGKRWGFFPSVSASWRIIEEGFLKDQNLLSDLKVRASWGNTGNQNSIGLYDYLAQMKIGDSYYPFGVNNAMTVFVRQNALASQERSWETVNIKNFALDYGFLKNRLTGSFEYYIKDNKDMLIPVELPAVIGFDVPTFNAGELRVWGWELALRWKDQIGKDFSYGINISLQDSRNKITKFEGAKNIISGIQNIEGYPIGSYFGYLTEGLFQSKDEVKEHAFQHLKNDAGDVKYVDLDGNGKINSGDLTYLGNIKPRYVYNIGVNMQYRGFDLELLFDGVGRKSVNLNQDLAVPVKFARFEGQTDYWTPENPSATWPRAYFNDTWNWWISDRTLHDASYFSCKNIQLGYNIPKQLLERIFVERLRLYVNVRNPFIIDNYVSYLDPRLNAYNNYPVLRSYTIGLNLTF